MRRTLILLVAFSIAGCPPEDEPEAHDAGDASVTSDAGADDASLPIDAAEQDDAAEEDDVDKDAGGPQQPSDASASDAGEVADAQQPADATTSGDAASEMDADAQHPSMDGSSDAEDAAQDAGGIEAGVLTDGGPAADAGDAGAQTCATLSAPAHGSIAFTADNQLGSVATYACDNGFAASAGDLTRTCSAAGGGTRWTGKAIRCAGCGDGSVSGSEECDPAAPNENLWTCSSDCKRLPSFRRCAGDPRSSGCSSLEVCVGGMCVPTCWANLNIDCPALPSGVAAGITANCQQTGSDLGYCYIEGCSTSSDCPSGAICSNGRCTGCTDSSQCPAETPTCTQVSGNQWSGANCQKQSTCNSNSDCSGNLVCGVVGIGATVKTCRKCETDAECPAQTPYCWTYFNDNDSCRADQP